MERAPIAPQGQPADSNIAVRVPSSAALVRRLTPWPGTAPHQKVIAAEATSVTGSAGGAVAKNRQREHHQHDERATTMPIRVPQATPARHRHDDERERGGNRISDPDAPVVVNP